jgi:hypothetical protein
VPPTQAYELVCDGAAILITMIAAADDDLPGLVVEVELRRWGVGHRFAIEKKLTAWAGGVSG